MLRWKCSMLSYPNTLQTVLSNSQYSQRYGVGRFELSGNAIWYPYGSSYGDLACPGGGIRPPVPVEPD